MSWYQVIQGRFLQYDTPLTLSYLFRTDILTVHAALDEYAALPYGRRTFKYAGRLTPIFNRPEIGLHRGRSRRLFLGKYQIEFDNPLGYEYALELQIHLWTPQLDLTIWQSDEEPAFDVNTELAFAQASLDRIESALETISNSSNL